MRVWWLIWFYAVDFLRFFSFFLGFKGDGGVIRDVGETVGKKRIRMRERERESKI